MDHFVLHLIDLSLGNQPDACCCVMQALRPIAWVVIGSDSVSKRGYIDSRVRPHRRYGVIRPRQRSRGETGAAAIVRWQTRQRNGSQRRKSGIPQTG